MAAVKRPPQPVRRVLVIDDHVDSRETLRLLLELAGHQVEVAEDGARGVQVALAWRPDVAVVDLGLPLLDGYAVAREVRAVLKDGIRLIALSGSSEPEDCQRVRDAGFDAHMSKPADFEELTRLVTL